jgi:hypothetical protein
MRQSAGRIPVEGWLSPHGFCTTVFSTAQRERPGAESLMTLLSPEELAIKSVVEERNLILKSDPCIL